MLPEEKNNIDSIFQKIFQNEDFEKLFPLNPSDFRKFQSKLNDFHLYLNFQKLKDIPETENLFTYDESSWKNFENKFLKKKEFIKKSVLLLFLLLTITSIIYNFYFHKLPFFHSQNKLINLNQKTKLLNRKPKETHDQLINNFHLHSAINTSSTIRYKKSSSHLVYIVNNKNQNNIPIKKYSDSVIINSDKILFNQNSHQNIAQENLFVLKDNDDSIKKFDHLKFIFLQPANLNLKFT